MKVKIQTKNSPTVYNSTYNVAQSLKFHPIKKWFISCKTARKNAVFLVVLVNFFHVGGCILHASYNSEMHTHKLITIAS